MFWLGVKQSFSPFFMSFVGSLLARGEKVFYMVELEKLKSKLIDIANEEGLNLDEYQLEKSINEAFRKRAKERINELNTLNFNFEEYAYTNNLSEDYKKVQQLESTTEQDKAISLLMKKVTPKVRETQIISKYGLESVSSWDLKRTKPLIYQELESEHKTQLVLLKKDTLVFSNVLRCNYTGEEYYKADFNQFVKDINQLLELNGVKVVLPLIPESNAWTLAINQFPKWENENATITLFKNRNVKIKFVDSKNAKLINDLYKEKYSKIEHFLIKEVN